jgi:hypothetical protein
MDNPSEPLLAHHGRRVWGVLALLGKAPDTYRVAVDGGC